MRQRQQLHRPLQQELQRPLKDENRVNLVGSLAESRTDSDESTLSRPDLACSSAPYPPEISSLTNLDRLMKSVTHLVPAQCFSEGTRAFGEKWRIRACLIALALASLCCVTPPCSREMQAMNSFLNSTQQIHLQGLQINGNSGHHRMQDPHLELTSSQDDFLEQMFSVLPTCSWPSDLKSHWDPLKCDEAGASNRDDNVGFHYDEILASKLKQHQPNGGGAMKMMMQQQMMSPGKGIAAAVKGGLRGFKKRSGAAVSHHQVQLGSAESEAVSMAEEATEKER
ncbi:hypothetical protein F3Y22_tig00112738pilonHSYRG00862 [Hibiscus syriacus]|uniref:Uncharacterized protein n=1 Tax=Hibiscus syriacus TaxID=106335 RepID=A0A6A2WUN8_HIBSY|nr:hypothetical protein F3Y22_tig00112738pilonHSYRG00862 [Hibiscus syriacus]